MSTENDTDRFDRVLTLIQEKASIRSYFCPLFEEHNRTFAFLTMPELLEHMLSHTDDQLERYREYNNELINACKTQESINLDMMKDYYSNISLEELIYLTGFSSLALEVYNFRVLPPKEEEPTEVLTEEVKETLATITKEEFVERLDAHNQSIENASEEDLNAYSEQAFADYQSNNETNEISFLDGLEPDIEEED